MHKAKKERIAEVIEKLKNFRFCSPSDDPEEIGAVTSGYHYLVIQLQRLAGDLLTETEQQRRLDSIKVDIDDLFSVYEANAEIDALLIDIEAALEQVDNTDWTVNTNRWIVEPTLISQIKQAPSPNFNFIFLSSLCEEINSSYKNGNIVATVLLMRAVLNYIPPAFGQDTFAQVSAHTSKSLKDSFNHLEKGLRKIADFQTHRRMTSGDLPPTEAQVEPYKPQFELLLQQVITQASKTPQFRYPPK